MGWLAGCLALVATSAGTGLGQTTQVSVATGGRQATGGDASVAAPEMTPDGRFVAFSSHATTLVPGDTNTDEDVFVHDRWTGETTRVSVGTGGVEAAGHSSQPAISADGRYVAFESRAANLVPGDTNGETDVFFHDRATGTTTRVSVASGHVQALGGDSFGPSLSADGRLVAFASSATNLVPGDTNGETDVFVHDHGSGTTTRVSVATGGLQASGGSSLPGALSADGRVVAFDSFATNLVAGDTNGALDVFVHDRQTGATTRVSVASNGAQGDAMSFRASISGDGRYVAFQSSANNLVAGDSGQTDVFLHDRQSGATTRLSVAPDGSSPDGSSYEPAISVDGRYVGFNSSATNLVQGDSNGESDAFVRDLTTGKTFRVSLSSDGTQGSGGSSYTPQPGAGGRYVVFASDAANLVPGDTNGRVDIFIHDTRAFLRRRVNVSSAGAEAAGFSELPALSEDGRYVAFTSEADNLVSGDTNGRADVFLRDRATGTTIRASVAFGGAQGDAESFDPALSADGRYVAFQSGASNLVPGDTNGDEDIFVYDRVGGAVTRVSIASDGAQTPGDQSSDPSISANGRYVAFVTRAANLVAGDTNGAVDAFVHDRVTRTTSRVSLGTGGTETNGDTYRAMLSGDGRFVAFESVATDVAAGFANGLTQIYVHDRQAATTTPVSVATDGTRANAHCLMPSISHDGRYVAFYSGASNLVAGDTNGLSDVFVRDLVAGVTTRVSVPTGGAQITDGVVGSLFISAPALSADGRLVVFTSDSGRLVENDANGRRDIFVHDRVMGVTRRVSLGDPFVEGNGDAREGVISADGRVIAYASDASNLVPADTNSATDIFMRAATPEIRAIAPRSGPDSGGTSVDIYGVGFAPGTTVSVGGTPALFVHPSASGTRLALTTPAHAPGPVVVRVDVPGYEPERAAYGFTYVTLTGSPTTDTDGDGIPDATEAAAGTHPRGRVTRYLAEGATGSFFDTSLALVNPGGANATALLRYDTAAGASVSQTLTLPPRTRTTVEVEGVPGLASAEFSTVLEADQPIVLDRLMRWDGQGYGSHLETAGGGASATWYLAEGATHSNFDLFYLLQNVQDTPADVTVTFLRPAPLAPIARLYTLAPRSRFTLWVDQVAPDLAAVDVSADIAASQPILVERAMYLSGARLFDAGHESAGVTAPALAWFLAEGATGSYFDLFVLLANPGATPAEVTGTYLKPDGTTITRQYVVPARSRSTIWVDYEDPALADTAVSTTMTVTNGVPIVVERAMWWPGPTAATWQEAHNSPGATTTGVAWATAAGEDGGAGNAETYLLVTNTADFSTAVLVTLVFENGSTAVREFVVAPRSRFNVAVRAEFPAAVGRRSGVLVESVGPGAAPLVVEQAVYADAGGVRWAAGANALATRIR
jgi:Tol biopolymer transport system component